MDSERRRVRKRRCIFTPTTTPQTKRASLQSTPNKFTAGSKKRLLHAIEHSNYDAAIRHILAEKSAAREALIRCVTKEICNEVSCVFFYLVIFLNVFSLSQYLGIMFS